MTHPLTDEMCEQIAPTSQWSGDIGDVVFRHSDMRAAADWQLEQVINWIKENGQDYVYYDHSLGYEMLSLNDFIADLREVMRPQQKEDNS